MRKPPANVLELPLEVRAEMALRAAVENLIEERAREGRSLIVWKDGKIADIPAEELLTELSDKS